MRQERTPQGMVEDTKRMLRDRKLAQTQASDSIQFVDITPMAYEVNHRGGLTVLFFFEADDQENAIVDATYDIFFNNALADPGTTTNLTGYTESYVRSHDPKVTICKISFYVEGASSRAVRVVPYIRSSAKGKIVSTQGIGGGWF